MPLEITMPKLSDTMTDGTLVKWHKKARQLGIPILDEAAFEKLIQ